MLRSVGIRSTGREGAIGTLRVSGGGTLAVPPAARNRLSLSTSNVHTLPILAVPGKSRFAAIIWTVRGHAEHAGRFRGVNAERRRYHRAFRHLAAPLRAIGGLPQLLPRQHLRSVERVLGSGIVGMEHHEGPETVRLARC